VSVTYIPVALRRLVEERAAGRCEYCLLPAAVAFFAHEVDHVIAEKHGGVTDDTNLAYTCWRCNRHKGTDLGSFDEELEDLEEARPGALPWERHAPAAQS
jgi:5-methylcytosine-specific restriction endonuclease McrA